MSSASAVMPSAAAPGPRVTVRPTRAGLVAAFLSLVMLAAALNTGNNLLYLLAALVIAALPVSVRLAKRSAGAVAVELLLPGEVTAGDEAAAALRVTAPTRGVVGLRVSQVGGGCASLPFVAGGSTVLSTLMLRTETRGPLHVDTWIDGLYPWGLMRARRAGPSGEMLVLPKPLPGAAVPAVLGQSVDGEPTTRPGQGQDLLEIRTYTSGDDARLIDWKATARRDRTMMRQGAREDERRATVVVDPALKGEGPEALARVERAISLAAGAVSSLTRSGWQVRLVFPGGDSRGSELEQLRTLARLEITEQSLPQGWWMGRVVSGEPVVICRDELVA